MEQNKKVWNQLHRNLKQALGKTDRLDEAKKLFLKQHAMLHSSKISKESVYSFEDEYLNGIGDDAWRMIPKKHNHSIAWVIWHLARIEDITMNLLVDLSYGWLDPRIRYG